MADDKSPSLDAEVVVKKPKMQQPPELVHVGTRAPSRRVAAADEQRRTQPQRAAKTAAAEQSASVIAVQLVDAQAALQEAAAKATEALATGELPVSPQPPKRKAGRPAKNPEAPPAAPRGARKRGPSKSELKALHEGMSFVADADGKELKKQKEAEDVKEEHAVEPPAPSWGPRAPKKPVQQVAAAPPPATMASSRPKRAQPVYLEQMSKETVDAAAASKKAKLRGSAPASPKRVSVKSAKAVDVEEEHEEDEVKASKPSKGAAAPAPKRPRNRKKIPSADTNWVESCDSPLIFADLKPVLSFDVFDRLIPPEGKDELLKLLPGVDCKSLESVRDLFRFNPFFRASMAEYQDGLSQGAFDSTADHYVYRQSQKRRKVMPDWKTRHFERHYGEKKDLPPPEPEIAMAPFSFVEHEKAQPRDYSLGLAALPPPPQPPPKPQKKGRGRKPRAEAAAVVAPSPAVAAAAVSVESVKCEPFADAASLAEHSLAVSPGHASPPAGAVSKSAELSSGASLTPDATQPSVAAENDDRQVNAAMAPPKDDVVVGLNEDRL